jgi:hypothetical protein
VGGRDGLTQPYLRNEVWLEFGDGEYLFKLKLPQLAELQEKCDAGIGTIYMRVMLGDYHAADLIESIRLGLIGGNKAVVDDKEIDVSDAKARKLVIRYCDRPLDELLELSRAILGACVVGYKPEDGDAGKNHGQATTSGSTSPAPTPTEPPSVD